MTDFRVLPMEERAEYLVAHVEEIAEITPRGAPGTGGGRRVTAVHGPPGIIVHDVPVTHELLHTAGVFLSLLTAHRVDWVDIEDEYPDVSIEPMAYVLAGMVAFTRRLTTLDRERVWAKVSSLATLRIVRDAIRTSTDVERSQWLLGTLDQVKSAAGKIDVLAALAKTWAFYRPDGERAPQWDQRAAADGLTLDVAPLQFRTWTQKFGRLHLSVPAALVAAKAEMWTDFEVPPPNGDAVGIRPWGGPGPAGLPPHDASRATGGDGKSDPPPGRLPDVGGRPDDMDVLMRQDARRFEALSSSGEADGIRRLIDVLPKVRLNMFEGVRQEMLRILDVEHPRSAEEINVSKAVKLPASPVALAKSFGAQWRRFPPRLRELTAPRLQALAEYLEGEASASLGHDSDAARAAALNDLRKPFKKLAKLSGDDWNDAAEELWNIGVTTARHTGEVTYPLSPAALWTFVAGIMRTLDSKADIDDAKGKFTAFANRTRGGADTAVEQMLRSIADEGGDGAGDDAPPVKRARVDDDDQPRDAAETKSRRESMELEKAGVVVLGDGKKWVRITAGRPVTGEQARSVVGRLASGLEDAKEAPDVVLHPDGSANATVPPGAWQRLFGTRKGAARAEVSLPSGLFEVRKAPDDGTPRREQANRPIPPPTVFLEMDEQSQRNASTPPPRPPWRGTPPWTSRAPPRGAWRARGNWSPSNAFVPRHT